MKLARTKEKTQFEWKLEKIERSIILRRKHMIENGARIDL